MKRWVILLHRYIGIPMSVVFVVWFVSGIVMIYTGDMPALGESGRLQGSGPLDFGGVSLSPAEAASASGFDRPLMQVSLGMLLGRPVYRFGRVFGPPDVVFADSGERFVGASAEAGRNEVARFTRQPVASVRFVAVVTEPDQWTMAEFDKLPLDRYDVDDGRATRAYFSRATGQVELLTNRSSRALAWAGAIPHWFYFTPLRLNQPLWYWTVVCVSGVGCLMAALGLILAVAQFRRSQPFRLAASIRYRGWMRWHYYTGAVFGVLALGWVFSGLMSMEPFEWTRASGMPLPSNDLNGGPLDLDRYRFGERAVVEALGDDVAEVELLRIRGQPYYLATSVTANGQPMRRVVAATTLAVRRQALPVEPVLAELRRTVSDAGIVDHVVLDEYDGYYYARGAPLPVLRVRFDDPARTWYYFDLTTYRTAGANHRLSRIERWLFNGLHSLDFSFWYYRRPVWDIGMIALSLGALATSAIGMYLGFRRLLRRPARTAV